MDYTQLTAQARQATEELLEAAHLETGDIFVVGCSSSEIMGGHIGHDSSMEAAAAVLAGVLLVAFLGTRLGLSIRATGDNAAMVGAQAYYEYLAGHTAGMELNACAQRSIDLG